MKKILLVFSILLTLSGCVGGANNVNRPNIDQVNLDQLYQKALDDAKLNQQDVIKHEINKRDFGYEVDIYTKDTKYDYDFDNQGAITKKSSENNSTQQNAPANNQPATNPATSPTGSTTSNQERISVEKAKQIAIDYAKVDAKAVSFIYAKLDFEDGINVYDVKFYDQSNEYEVEVDAHSGQVREYDFEPKGL